MVTSSHTEVSILVVDDDPDMLRGTTRILDRAGYATATADSGEAALAAMSLQHPNLVLLDWDMPGMDGIEVCKQIKGNPAFSDSLVIMISAIHTESEEQAAGLESGADGYISRPISNRELVARVESFARIWDLHHSLRESEARVRSMLHATPIGLGMTLDGIFTEVNEAVVRMTGYRRDELIGQFDRMLFASDAEFDRVGINQDAQILEQGIGAQETRWQRKNNGLRDIHLSTAPTDPAQRDKGITFSAQDITEHKLAEQALRDSEARYRELFESNPHPMWVYDLETLAFLAVNDAAIAHYGYSRAEFLAMTIRDIRPAEDVARLMEVVASVRSSLSSTDLWRHRRKDGSFILVEIAGHSLTFGNRPARLIHAHDVSARHFAEEQLRLSKENLSITLNSIGDAVIATDPTGLITRMNPTAERLTGWPLGEALGKPLADVFQIVNAQSRTPVSDPVRVVITSNQVVGLANDTTLLARDGQEYQIADSAAPIRDAAQEIVGVVIVFNDVTEKYQAQAALKASEERFRRLTALSSDFYWETDVAHRFTLRSEGTRADTQSIFPGGTPLGKRRWEISYVSPDEAGWQAHQAMLDAHLPFRDFRFSRQTDKGAVRHLSVSGEPMFDVCGSFKGYRGVGADITAQVNFDIALHESDARFRATFEQAAVGMAHVAPDGRWLRVNQKVCDIVGYTREQLLAGRFQDITHPDDLKIDIEHVRQLLAAKISTYTRDKRYLHKNGGIVWIQLTVSLVRQVSGEPDYFIAVIKDIADRKAAEERIETLAFYDVLTGLPNRALLRDRLQHALAASSRSQLQAALLHIDLDNFKSINDTLGHEQGDRIIEEVAMRLRACTRASDTLARIGGDEFILLLEDPLQDQQDPANQAREVANKVLGAMRQAFALGQSIHHCSVSIGITLFGGGKFNTVDEPMKQAELAMYQAKAAGRDTLRFFDPQMEAAVSARANLESRLREGLVHNQFVLHYQPQFDETGQVTGSEALVRWLDPKRGMVSPSEFIPVAEQSGLILPLGQWVLESACGELARWGSEPAMAHLTVAVNVSARQFHQNTFVEQVLDTLKRTGANPKRLKIELTESMLVDDVEAVIAKMSALKGYGVNFSLDDFGTGYSSLAYLKRLPLNQLKIDQGFVRDILVDANDAAIAKMVIALAQSMGLAVIAEGVETEGQRDFLANAGCRAFQGYLFSKPLALNEFEAFVAKV